MFLILGLGNPGPDYETTRHNVGFLVADVLASMHGIDIGTHGEGCLLGRGTVKGEEVLIAKPLTFMNRSGSAALRLIKAFDVQPGSFIVVYDDSDLSFGKIRIRKGGGHAGHRGLKDIIEKTGLSDFPRVRVGIGRPKGSGLADYVLSPFTPEELEFLSDVIERGAGSVEAVITEGIEAAMNRYNR